MKNKQYYEKKYGVELYPFQIDIINKILEYGNNVCFFIGRGCGKTRIMSMVAKEMKEIYGK